MAVYDHSKGSEIPEVSDLIETFDQLLDSHSSPLKAQDSESGNESGNESENESGIETPDTTPDTTSIDEARAANILRSSKNSKPIIPSEMDARLRELVNQKLPVIKNELEILTDSALRTTDPERGNIQKYIKDGVATQTQDLPINPEPVLIAADPVGLKPLETVPDIESRLEIRTHAIIGTYTVETQHISQLSDNDWYAEIFLNTKKIAVSTLNVDAIIELRAKLVESIKKDKTKIQGLDSALEELLLGMNNSERARVLEKQAEFLKRSGSSSRSSTATQKARTAKTQRPEKAAKGPKPSNKFENAIYQMKN